MSVNYTRDVSDSDTTPVVWTCPDCGAWECDTAEVIAFLVASHQHCDAVSREGYPCDRTSRHETHEHAMPCGATATWVSVT